MSETPQEYLARIGAVGGAKSRRKLSKKEARRIAKVRWAAGAGRGAEKARGTKKGKAPNDSSSPMTRAIRTPIQTRKL